MIDRNLWAPSRQAVQKPAPIMPSGAAPRIVGLVHQTGNSVEGLDLLRVLAEREFDFGLLDNGVDAAQPVGFRIGQQIEAVEGIVEVSQRLAVGPAALRLLSRQDRVVNRLFRLVAAPEVQRQEFCDFVGPTAVKLLESAPDSAVMD